MPWFKDKITSSVVKYRHISQRISFNWHCLCTWMSLSGHPTVKCKCQMRQNKCQAMWADSHLISSAKFLQLNKVSLYVVFGILNKSYRWNISLPIILFYCERSVWRLPWTSILIKVSIVWWCPRDWWPLVASQELRLKIEKPKYWENSLLVRVYTSRKWNTIYRLLPIKNGLLLK